MKVERIHHATVVSPDAEDAKGTFESLFNLAPAAADTPALAIGDARIEFVTPASGTRLGEALATGGEGMAEICLRVASLADAAERLRGASIAFEQEDANGQRVLHIDPRAAHGARLTLRDTD